LPVEAAVMRRKGKVKTQEILFPGPAETKAWHQKLPRFQAYDTKKLLVDARALRKENTSLDEAVNTAYGTLCRGQVAQLLRLLECDPKVAHFWRSAFIKLARIHHNVGGLVHKLPPQTLGARLWTSEAEAVLLMEVRRLMDGGFGENEAIKILAENPSYASVFPYRAHRADERLKGHATRKARVNALRRKYFRLMEDARSTPGPLQRALGRPRESSFEWFLWWRENSFPEPALTGDKGPRKKKRIRKSPSD
jgi:hypothetical protein